MVNGKIIAMLSGNPLLFSNLVPDKISKTNGIAGIANKIKENFKKTRLKTIDEEMLEPLLVNREFLIKAISEEIPNQYVDSMIDSVTKFRLDTAILLAGVENDRGSVIMVSETGVHDFGEIGFHGIGSGYTEAMNTLLFQQQHRECPLSETVYNVFKAKKNAEVSEGVGRWTDMLILSEDSQTVLSDEDLRKLSGVYEEELEFGKHHKALNDILNRGK